MTLTTHSLTGAVTGKYFQNPVTIIISAIVVHYVIDTLRHGEYLDRKSSWRDTTWKVSLDIFIGLSIVLLSLFFAADHSWNVTNIFIGMFFSMLPDLFTLLY